jgi:protocatechuate 3,4-dioxygenase beta subunit
MGSNPFAPDRRHFLRVWLASPLVFALSRQLGIMDTPSAEAALLAAATGGSGLSPTPDCDDNDEPTPRQTAGPFFTPQSPKRRSLLEPALSGTRIDLSGRVFGRDCMPIAGALLDFWHADDDGAYDNEGYRLRGHQFTDAEGRYRLSTIVPGLYPGRTRHFHVKVQPPGGRILTTQIYFPDEPRNRRDGLFRPDLLMAIETEGALRRGSFHFVLDTGGRGQEVGQEEAR